MKIVQGLLLCGLLLFSFGVAGQDVLDISDRVELFVDRHVIESMENVRLELQTPRAGESVLRFDKPWEGRYCGYVTVIQDGPVYRMYYRGLPTAGKDGSDVEVTCYAESRDGVEWTKPELELYEWGGSKKNNIILSGHAPLSHNFSPFLDTNPDCPAEERYKAVAGTMKSGLVAFVSPDGVRWTKLRDEPVFRDGVFDSQNVAFWSESEQRYVCYFRVWSDGGFKGYRSVGKTTSTDFVNWTEPQEMTYGGTTREHLYTNQTHPYFRSPHLYIAIAARFMPGRRIMSPEDFEKLGGEAAYSGDVSDTVFMTSRGGYTYDRTFMEGFVRPGLGLSNWSSRTNYPALGVVQTGEDEMSFYVQRNYGQTSAYLQRMAMRLDGFVSVHAGYDGGEMVTKPLRFDGDELVVNVATSAAGSVWVELQDVDGNALPGYALEDCDEIVGDTTSRTVTWKRNATLPDAPQEGLRLRFRMKDADLFSMQVR